MANQATALLCGPRNELFQISHEFGGDNTQAYAQTHPEYHQENIAARMKIVDALGGSKAVQRITEIAYPIRVKSEILDQIRSGAFDNRYVDAPMTGYMDELQRKFQAEELPQGASIAQVEDPAGRKALVLQLVDKISGSKAVEVIFQRRRETCIDGRYEDGIRWISKVLSSAYESGVDKIAEQLKLVVDGKHPRYALKV